MYGEATFTYYSILTDHKILITEETSIAMFVDDSSYLAVYEL